MDIVLDNGFGKWFWVQSQLLYIRIEEKMMEFETRKFVIIIITDITTLRIIKEGFMMLHRKTYYYPIVD